MTYTKALTDGAKQNGAFLLKEAASFRVSYKQGIQAASRARLPLVVIERANSDLQTAYEFVRLARATRTEVK